MYRHLAARQRNHNIKIMIQWSALRPTDTGTGIQQLTNTFEQVLPLITNATFTFTVLTAVVFTGRIRVTHSLAFRLQFGMWEPRKLKNYLGVHFSPNLLRLLLVTKQYVYNYTECAKKVIFV